MLTSTQVVMLPKAWPLPTTLSMDWSGNCSWTNAASSASSSGTKKLVDSQVRSNCQLYQRCAETIVTFRSKQQEKCTPYRRLCASKRSYRHDCVLVHTIDAKISTCFALRILKGSAYRQEWADYYYQEFNLPCCTTRHVVQPITIIFSIYGGWRNFHKTITGMALGGNTSNISQNHDIKHFVGVVKTSHDGIGLKR